MVNLWRTDILKNNENLLQDNLFTLGKREISNCGLSEVPPTIFLSNKNKWTIFICHKIESQVLWSL